MSSDNEEEGKKEELRKLKKRIFVFINSNSPRVSHIFHQKKALKYKAEEITEKQSNNVRRSKQNRE